MTLTEQPFLSREAKRELLDHLDESGVRQQDVAIKLGTSASKIGRIIRGEDPMPNDFVRDAHQAIYSTAEERLDKSRTKMDALGIPIPIPPG